VCQYILEKFPNIKFHENPFNGSPVVYMGSHKYGEANRSIFAMFACKCVSKQRDTQKDQSELMQAYSVLLAFSTLGVHYMTLL
jgi:hypothetical protein